MSCEIINNLPNIENKTYLELGIRDNKNFEAINCKELMSVDVNGRAKFTGTTDEYFDLHGNTRYDIVFIDANHDRDFVVRDFNNSIKIANEWILIHDMIPPSIKYTASKFCSDSFRVLHHLLSKTDMTVYPMDENYGLTLIKLPGTSIELEQDSNELSWHAFVEFMKDKKVYSHSEVNQILRNTHV